MGRIVPGTSASDAALAGDRQPAKTLQVQRRRLRLAAWVLLGVLSVAYYAVLNSPLPPVSRFLGMELIYCTPIVVTVLLGLRSRALSEGAERAFWGFLSAANAVLLGCELLLIWWVLVLDPMGPPRVSWPFHIMHGVAAVFFLGLIVSMSRLTQIPLVTKLRWTLDSAALALIAAAALLTVYVRPVMAPADAPVSHLLLGTGYPLFGLLMMMGTLGNVVGMKVDRWRTWDTLTALSLAIYACAISLWPLWYGTAVTTSRNYERGLLDLVQFGGHWLLMMAAVYRLTELSVRPLKPLAPPSDSKFKWAHALVPALSIVAIPALAWLAYVSLPDRGSFVVYTVTLTLITVLALARSVAVALEHGALFHRSITDPLTGLYNHRFFHDRLSDELSQAQRYGEHLAVITLDLDDFGRFNELHGHLGGDRLLAEVGALIRSVTPAGAIPARLGGDEFGVLAPTADSLDALVLARRMLDIVGIQAGGHPGGVSFSAGIAVYPDHADDPETLLRLADGALFDAKGSGKSTVVLYDAERVPDLSATDRIARLERQSRLAAVRALAAAVDARDASTQDHSYHVAGMAGAVGRHMGLTDEAVRRVETAALLHDVGKIAVADSLLKKGAPLTDAEADRVRSHVVLGQQILASAGLEELMPVVRSHHERWDGGGYPDGLAGDEIPFEARILAVCDAFEAITTDTPTRIALSREAALTELSSAAGSQFDPEVVSALAVVVHSR